MSTISPNDTYYHHQDYALIKNNTISSEKIRIISKLAKGQFGQVYKGKNQILDLQVNLFQKLTTSAEHIVYQNCSECQNKSNNLCTQYVLQIF